MDKRMERLFKALGIGAGIGFVSWIFSGSDVSLPLALLVAYLEYKFK